MKKEYTWYPDNQERFSEVFDSIEQAIENAQKKFDSKADEYDEDEENSSVIIIGLVEYHVMDYFLYQQMNINYRTAGLPKRK